MFKKEDMVVVRIAGPPQMAWKVEKATVREGIGFITIRDLYSGDSKIEKSKFYRLANDEEILKTVLKAVGV